MSVFLTSYTKALKRYDADLYAGRTMDGVVCVFRRSKRYEPVCVSDGFKFLNLKEDKQFIFALTDTWNLSGVPRDWGIEFVLNRIKEIDALANERMFEEIDAQNEKIDESKKRDIRNEIESFWIDQRRSFAKATNDIRTSQLSMDEPKRRLKDKRLENRSKRNGND